MKLQLNIPATMVALLLVTVACQSAFADIHAGHDVLGLSTEADETGVFELADYPAGPLSLYLMVYGYDHPQGIVAWDCAIILPPGILLTDTNFMGRGINAHPQPYNFQVTTLEPLMAVNGMVHLATLDLLVIDDDPQQFFLSADPLWVDHEYMGFAWETSPSMRQPFNWPNRCEDCPVFQIINIPQATDGQDWDQVKALYR